MTVISSALFMFSSYGEHNMIGVAEASEVRLPDLTKDISIRSTKTGVVVKFKFSHIQRDRENEILFWEYLPEENASHRCAKIKIIND